MENIKRRDSILGMFFNSFRGMATNSKTEENGRVDVDDLSKDDKRELAEVLKASGNVKKIEKAMGMNKYKATVDTDKAQRVAVAKNKQKVIEEDKTRDNK